MRAKGSVCALVMTLAVAVGCSSDDPVATPTTSGTPTASTAASATGAPSPSRPTSRSPRTLVTDLHVPWGLVFLPDGSALVSERTTGKILRIPRDGGAAKTAMTVPGVNFDGEGGLLGLALSPSYAQDKLVYAYYTTNSDNRIARFQLGGTIRPILTGIDFAGNHNGGRIAFGPDGRLYAGVGDAGNRSNAQDRGSLNGKILRLNPDGSVPSDNPFGTVVWTWGHRNVQGLSWDADGRLWATEFGQDTWDEVNLIQKGRNYGWPDVEGRGDTRGGKYTNPKVIWTTDEASPSGSAIVGSTLYVAALRGQCLWRVPLSGANVGTPSRALHEDYGRLRTAERAPDGALWVTTSNRDGRGNPRGSDDRIVRIAV
jgi:glucose/arabinose dehydrogenase